VDPTAQAVKAPASASGAALPAQPHATPAAAAREVEVEVAFGLDGSWRG